MDPQEIRMQTKMSLGIVKDCYADCVNNFSSDQLSSSEKTCLQNCAKRTMQMFMVFGEAQQGIMSRQGGMQQFWETDGIKRMLLKRIILHFTLNIA